MPEEDQPMAGGHVVDAVEPLWAGVGRDRSTPNSRATNRP